MLVPLLGFTFLPNTDLGKISIDAGLDSGLSLEAAGQKAKELESIANLYPEVQSTYTTVGKDKVSIFINLSDKLERKAGVGEIVEKMRNDYEKNSRDRSCRLFSFYGDGRRQGCHI